jgi:hypothetical protein
MAAITGNVDLSNREPKEATELGTQAAAQSQTSSDQAARERFGQLMQDKRAGKGITGELWHLVRDFPRFGIGYAMLARPHLARGEFGKARAIYRVGLRVQPNDDVLNAFLLGCMDKPSVRRRAMHQYVRRFPFSRHTSTILIELAETAPTRVERLKLLRRAATLNKEGPTFVNVQRLLSSELATTDLQHAAKVAEAALKRLTDNDQAVASARYDVAFAQVTFLRSLAAVDRLLKLGRAEAAVSALQQITQPNTPHVGVGDNDRVLLTLTWTRALAEVGQMQDAYDRVIGDDLALTRIELLDAATRLGHQLGKSRRQVEDECWARKLAVDNAVAQFEVPGPRGRKVKAEDYRGRVLLVCVWNPG